ncbi:hypothetical protein BH10ACI3_BH10ACI3_16840 [soil metagenome]
MKRSLTVTKQTCELNVLYRPRLKDRMYCTDCGSLVRWVFPEEAMALLGTNLRDIFRRIERYQVHFVETTNGFPLICAESLNLEPELPAEENYEIEKNLIAA